MFASRFLSEAHQFGREDWTHEIETASKYGNLEAFIFLSNKLIDPPSKLASLSKL